MSENNMTDLNVLEEEFNQEVKGYGSLSINIVGGEASSKLGYQIRPEDIEALYFDGIGTQRWESIKANDVDEQLKIYNESMDSIMKDYPMIGRVKDTDITVEYSAEEVSQLNAECEKVIENTTHEKAIRSVQKFQIACTKATECNGFITLNPS